MIKINTISNNKNWKRYIENPEKFIEKKIINFNKKFRKYKNKKFFAPFYFPTVKKLKN